MAIVTSTEIRNHFGKYLQFVMDGGEVVITRNGQKAGRLISRKDSGFFPDRFPDRNLIRKY